MLTAKKNKENAPNESAGFNVLNEGTTIKGDIESKGDIRIDGVVIGSIKTASKLVLGKNGRIEGNIFATCCDINGKVDGNLKVSDILYVKATGMINGDILTGKLVVESGGKFNGQCSMGGVTASLEGRKPEEKQGAA